MNDHVREGQPAATGLTLVSTFEDNAECATAVATDATDTAPSLSGRFEQFHRQNPQVYACLVRLAREWVRKTGRTKLGVAALWERMRWELAISTSDPIYRLNNDYRSYYARLIMCNEPELHDLFEVRRSAADSWLDQRAA